VNRSRDLDSTLERLERFGVRLGLETTHRLLEGLGNPQLGYPVVLVAGTNGKGSTAALLESMARASGYRVGLHTSPHLESVEERIRVDGFGIAKGDLASLVARVVDTSDRQLGHAPTYFEALTAAAFEHFARVKVDLAVVEVGLGGRLDATNASEPILSLITEIGLEHQAFLGNSLAAIAGEKAGILRPGAPAVGWLEHPEARAVVRQRADSLGTDLTIGSEAASISSTGAFSLAGQELVVTTPKRSYRVALPLLGEFQQPNLALAVLAAERLADHGFRRLTPESIVQGVAGVRWPARLELARVSEESAVLLDVAHNPDGARVLRSFLESLARPYNLLYGTLDDKDVGSILPLLAELADQVVLTAPSSPRALEPTRFHSSVQSGSVVVVPKAKEALTRLLDCGGSLALVCGSVHLVGELRQELRRRFGVPYSAVDLVPSLPQASES